MVDISILTMVYKPTNITGGASPCMWMFLDEIPTCLGETWVAVPSDHQHPQL
jgi:hypothetical protein